jgi:hypothetical protein
MEGGKEEGKIDLVCGKFYFLGRKCMGEGRGQIVILPPD